MSPLPAPAPAVVYVPSFPEPPAATVANVLEAVAAYFSAKGEVRGAERTATRAKVLKDLTANGLAPDAVDWAVQRHIEAGRIRAEATECWTHGIAAVWPGGFSTPSSTRSYWDRKVEGCTLVGTEPLFSWRRELVESRGKVRTVVPPPDPLGILPGNDLIKASSDSATASTTPFTFGILLEQLRHIDVCRRELADDPERGTPGFGYRVNQLEVSIAELGFQTHPMKGRLETHTDFRGEAFDAAGLRLLRGEVAMRLGCGADTVNAMTLEKVVAELDAMAAESKRVPAPVGPPADERVPPKPIGLTLLNGNLVVNGEKRLSVQTRTYRVLDFMLKRESAEYEALIDAAADGDSVQYTTITTWANRVNNALSEVGATWRLETDSKTRTIRKRPA